MESSSVVDRDALRFVNRRYAQPFAKDNPKLAAHLRVGWQLAGEEDNFYFVVLPLNATAESASGVAPLPSQR